MWWLYVTVSLTDVLDIIHHLGFINATLFQKLVLVSSSDGKCGVGGDTGQVGQFERASLSHWTANEFTVVAELTCTHSWFHVYQDYTSLQMLMKPSNENVFVGSNTTFKLQFPVTIYSSSSAMYAAVALSVWTWDSVWMIVLEKCYFLCKGRYHCGSSIK